MQHQTLYLTGASYWCRGFHHEHHQSWKVKYSSTEALISSDCTKFLNIYELSVFFHWFYLWFLRLCWIELFPNVLRMSGQFVSALWWFLSNSPTFICLYFIFVWLLFPRKLIIARAALWQKNSNFSPSLSLFPKIWGWPFCDQCQIFPYIAYCMTVHALYISIL